MPGHPRSDGRHRWQYDLDCVAHAHAQRLATRTRRACLAGLLPFTLIPLFPGELQDPVFLACIPLSLVLILFLRSRIRRFSHACPHCGAALRKIRPRFAVASFVLVCDSCGLTSEEEFPHSDSP